MEIIREMHNFYIKSTHGSIKTLFICYRNKMLYIYNERLIIFYRIF